MIITFPPSSAIIHDHLSSTIPHYLLFFSSSIIHYHPSSNGFPGNADYPGAQVLPLFADPPCNFEEDKVQAMAPMDFHLRHALVAAGVGTPTVAGECGPLL